METFFLFTASVRDPVGSKPRDPAIEGSGLAQYLKETFRMLRPPPTIGGCIKVVQRTDNIDAFDLHFYSVVHSELYRAGSTYHDGLLPAFERSDFEDFPETKEMCRQRISEFFERLCEGELTPM